MSSSPSSSSPIPEGLKPHKRRTKFMVAQENKQILDYIISGATHEQIRKWIGLSKKNYRKRIAVIRKRDLELTKAEQTPEAHAFLYRRMDEKFHRLKVMTLQIADSKTAQVRDKLEAMRFLVQIYEDEFSLFLYGPLHFLVKDAGAPPAAAGGSNADTSMENPLRNRQDKPQWPWGIDDIGEDEDDTDDDGGGNAVF